MLIAFPKLRQNLASNPILRTRQLTVMCHTCRGGEIRTIATRRLEPSADYHQRSCATAEFGGVIVIDDTPNEFHGGVFSLTLEQESRHSEA